MKVPFYIGCAVLISTAFAHPTNTQMTGGNFEIYADSFSVIDTGLSTGGNFTITDTGGDPFAQISDDGNIELRGGFQAAEKGILQYTASASTVNLGTLSSGSVSSGSITLSISTDSETGYSISMSEDGNLRDGANDIDDVADGTVTAGSEEYGISTAGSDGQFNSTDTSISGAKVIASAEGGVTDRETTVTFKASVTGGTNSGSYTHDVTFDVTVNP